MKVVQEFLVSYSLNMIGWGVVRKLARMVPRHFARAVGTPVKPKLLAYRWACVAIIKKDLGVSKDAVLVLRHSTSHNAVHPLELARCPILVHTPEWIFHLPQLRKMRPAWQGGEPLEPPMEPTCTSEPGNHFFKFHTRHIPDNAQ